MGTRLQLTLLMCLIFIAGCTEPERVTVATPANQCLSCHENHQSGFSEPHAFAKDDCTVCHAGQPGSNDIAEAHRDLIAFPGNLDNAEQTCGACHAEQVHSVTHSLMHTARGMVHVTRNVLDGSPGPEETQNLQNLGDSVADSMLRKQCASCHLGQLKTEHAVNETTDRGGGCLACHINEYQADAHPTLSRDISDARCFGCHSRSSRISLSYVGLAETEKVDLRLADGRKVTQMPADIHYQAGMRCTSCHTADDVMDHAEDAISQREAVHVTCTDCHEPHADDTSHERLTCATCHSQWAPQCYGCHMEYDESGEQWDHIEQKVTPGEWSDRMWNIRNSAPVLGINSDGRIDTFVPGMIMTVDHPSWAEEKFVRLFAPISAHTIGPARSCESCHQNSEALGLGQGSITVSEGKIIFEPAAELIRDGLPADAWTNPQNTLGGRAPFPGQRPFSEAEMLKILQAPIPD